MILEVDKELIELEKMLNKFDFQKMLSGEYDEADAICIGLSQYKEKNIILIENLKSLFSQGME